MNRIKLGFKKRLTVIIVSVLILGVIAFSSAIVFLQSNNGKALTIKGRQYTNVNIPQNWGIKLTLLKTVDFMLAALPQPELIQFDRNNSITGFSSKPQIDSHSIKALSLLAINLHSVDTVEKLRRAMLKAKKGDVILLAPGQYTVLKRLEVKHSGTQNNPIKLISIKPGSTVLDIKNTEGIYLDKANWHIENIVFKGSCAQHRDCEHAIHLYGNADNTWLVNNQFIDFNAALKSNGNYRPTPALFPDNVLVKNNDFYNQTTRLTSTPATPIDVVGGNNWVVESNFIADFSRQLTGRVSVTYGGFMKGGGTEGTFNNNVINCAWRLPYQSSLDVRVGLSFGNGGTQREFCQNTDCEYEHMGGKITNNLILNCINDVSIYLNKASATEISGNTLLNSLGIDARFKQTSVTIKGNRLQGRVNARDNAFISERDNVMVN